MQAVSSVQRFEIVGLHVLLLLVDVDRLGQRMYPHSEYGTVLSYGRTVLGCGRASLSITRRESGHSFLPRDRYVQGRLSRETISVEIHSTWCVGR